MTSDHMFLIVFLFIFTPASVRSDWATNIEAATYPDNLMGKPIPFNEVGKVLLTEKFFRVEFLVSFPIYNFTMKPDTEKIFHKLSHMWETPFIFRH